MARLGIDATTVTLAGKGHSRTQRKTVESLAALGLPHELVAFVRGPEGEHVLAASGVRCVRMRNRKMLAWEQVGLPRAVARERIDVVLTLTDRLPVWGSGRYVVWLFEIPTHRIEQNRQRRAGLYQHASDLVTQALWKRSLRSGTRVIAGSEATAAEITAAVPALAGRVRVVYPGLGDGFEPGQGKREERYVLHLASSDPRDNSETALAAFAAARARLGEPVRLVLAGGIGDRRAPLEAETERLGIGPWVELTGRVSDEELVALYQGASAYLDATLFEGFGYQVLEAMACGAPVVASSASSIPEVVGEAGLVCDPRSSDELAAALMRVLDEPGLADELRRRGFERAALFTWERTARELAVVLEEALRE